MGAVFSTSQTEQVLSMSEQESNHNVEQIGECATLIQQISRKLVIAQSSLTPVETQYLYEIEDYLNYLLREHVYELAGAAAKIETALSDLHHLSTKQRARLAVIAENAAIRDILACDQRLEKLLELQLQVCRCYTKISRGNFIRLIKRINDALAQRHYECDNFDLVLQDISAHLARAITFSHTSTDVDLVSDQLILHGRKLASTARTHLDTSAKCVDKLLKLQNEVIDVNWKIHKPNLLRTRANVNHALAERAYLDPRFPATLRNIYATYRNKQDTDVCRQQFRTTDAKRFRT